MSSHLSTAMMQSQHEPASTESFCLKTAQRQCRGSLPLKKRRFNKITTFHEKKNLSQASASDPVTSIALSNPSGIDLGCNNLNKPTDEKIAALALVAAAAGGHHFPENSGGGKIQQDARQITSHLLQYNSEQQHNIISNPLHNQYPISMISKKVTTLSKNGNVGVDGSDNAMKPVPASQPRQRVHHPPLSAPIPGGCHGRTSRNNSFCRRTPCYNGSKYCKLHYQQYVVQGGADPNGGSCFAIKLNGGDLKMNGKSQGRSTLQHCNGFIEGVENVTSHHRTHQDKRYTGQCVGEMQCLATTTRGRSCAYVAVAGTKYCHLHADYDTNPPPRRGGSGGNNNRTKAIGPTKAGPSSSVESMAIQTSLQKKLDYPHLSQCNGVHAPNSLQDGMVESGKNKSIAPCAESSVNMLRGVTNIGDELQIKKNGMFVTTINNSKAHEQPTPYPLLNSIPSDKWSQRLVLIANGPFANYSGRVVKWGNGWITVALSEKHNANGDVECFLNKDDGKEFLHNRRAIELYLLPDNVECKEQDSKNSPSPSKEIVETETSQFLIPSSNLALNSLQSVASDNNPLIARNNDQQKVGRTGVSAVSHISSLPSHDMSKSDAIEVPSESVPRLEQSVLNDACTVKVETKLKVTNNDIKEKNSECGEVLKTHNDYDCRIAKPSETINSISSKQKEPCIESVNLLFENDTSASVKSDKINENRLSLVEGLILAQTGRLVKNGDLALVGSSGRKIQKPERCENSVAIEKKRNGNKQEIRQLCPSPKLQKNDLDRIDGRYNEPSHISLPNISNEPRVVNQTSGGSAEGTIIVTGTDEAYNEVIIARSALNHQRNGKIKA